MLRRQTSVAECPLCGEGPHYCVCQQAGLAAPAPTLGRFIVTDELGPRGVQLHRVEGDVAWLEWNVLFSGETRDLFKWPAAALFETYDAAVERAIERKKELQG